MKINGEDVAGFCGTVWDYLEQHKYQVERVAVEKYINDSNEIQVKFVNTSMESNCILPYLSYYKKN